MQKIQCPAGEHCLEMNKGGVCLMWHPSSATKKSKGHANKDQNLQDEEDEMLQLALKKSLEPPKIYCNFCKVEFESTDGLQLHHMDVN